MNLLKTTTAFRNRFTALLAFACLLLLVSSPVCAQYNLAVAPASPIAGQNFLVTADGNPCFTFITGPQPPWQLETTVTLGVLQVKAVALENFPCSVSYNSLIVSFPGVPEGNYELQLIGRDLEDPPNEYLLESIQIVVGPAFVSSGVETIPATETAGHALLILATALVAAVWLVQRGR